MRRPDLHGVLLRARLRPGPWLRFQTAKGAYRMLDENEARRTRRSDTVFVFGSGASLNELSAAERAHFEEHDTLGFNWFVHQQFVRCDYHLIRGIPDTDVDPRVWRPQLDEYFRLLRTNARFAATTYLVHSGFRAINGNRAIGYRLLPKGNAIFLWRTNSRAQLPSERFEDGLVHGQSTIQECINFAYLLGWKQIVLVGVDLYDRRYFWLGAEETRSVDLRRGATAEDAHARAASGLVETLGIWRGWLGSQGVELSVYNPRSLLAGALPVYVR